IGNRRSRNRIIIDRLNRRTRFVERGVLHATRRQPGQDVAAIGEGIDFGCRVGSPWRTEHLQRSYSCARGAEFTYIDLRGSVVGADPARGKSAVGQGYDRLLRDGYVEPAILRSIIGPKKCSVRAEQLHDEGGAEIESIDVADGVSAIGERRDRKLGDLVDACALDKFRTDGVGGAIVALDMNAHRLA